MVINVITEIIFHLALQTWQKLSFQNGYLKLVLSFCMDMIKRAINYVSYTEYNIFSHSSFFFPVSSILASILRNKHLKTRSRSILATVFVVDDEKLVTLGISLHHRSGMRKLYQQFSKLINIYPNYHAVFHFSVEVHCFCIYCDEYMTSINIHYCSALSLLF